ncbi:MAG: hypothetical protein LUD01_00515, partial [Clostridiales bacterium]|nr:hypothetical protein [Clostridiales bacterium]
GYMQSRVELICKKMKKDQSIPAIAETLEEDESRIRRIYDVALKYAPEYDVEKIVRELRNQPV